MSENRFYLLLLHSNLDLLAKNRFILYWLNFNRLNQKVFALHPHTIDERMLSTMV